MSACNRTSSETTKTQSSSWRLILVQRNMRGDQRCLMYESRVKWLTLCAILACKETEINQIAAWFHTEHHNEHHSLEETGIFQNNCIQFCLSALANTHNPWSPMVPFGRKSSAMMRYGDHRDMWIYCRFFSSYSSSWIITPGRFCHSCSTTHPQPGGITDELLKSYDVSQTDTVHGNKRTVRRRGRRRVEWRQGSSGGKSNIRLFPQWSWWTWNKIDGRQANVFHMCEYQSASVPAFTETWLEGFRSLVSLDWDTRVTR